MGDYQIQSKNQLHDGFVEIFIEDRTRFYMFSIFDRALGIFNFVQIYTEIPTNQFVCL